MKTYRPRFFSARETPCPSRTIDSAVTNSTKCYAASVAFVKMQLPKLSALTFVPLVGAPQGACKPAKKRFSLTGVRWFFGRRSFAMALILIVLAC